MFGIGQRHCLRQRAARIRVRIAHHMLDPHRPAGGVDGVEQDLGAGQVVARQVGLRAVAVDQMPDHHRTRRLGQLSQRRQRQRHAGRGKHPAPAGMCRRVTAQRWVRRGRVRSAGTGHGWHGDGSHAGAVARSVPGTHDANVTCAGSLAAAVSLGSRPRLTAVKLRAPARSYDDVSHTHSPAPP
ncbi:hypothetical protein CBM2586_A10081 [Cupriavidus phytorum]|uniref:Uncharacterized protein n=1 Tax=Cupriavidus taiwanensis TaxID=164546 RepID=A0A375B8X5_9BURK|nr:hypothetical protein CBM2586_A10081 [Cupriavidus taiwanensis]